MTEQEAKIVRAGIWAERIESEPALNAERLEWFESVKAVLVDRCARPSKIKPAPANVVSITSYSKGERSLILNCEPVWGPGMGFWAP